MAMIIKNGTVVTENGARLVDIRCENGKITEIAETIDRTADDEVYDAKNKIVMPGVIDAHVHYNMKTKTGRTIDNFETGSLSAAFGGITTVIDFASPQKGLKLLDALKAREAEARGHSFVDYNFHMEITGHYEIDFEELCELPSYGINSLKIYTTYGDTELPKGRIPALLKKAKELGLFVIVHAEDNEIILAYKEQFIKEGKTKPSFHADTRPPQAEVKAIREVLEMAKQQEAKIYIVHVSTGEGCEIIREVQARGQDVLAETCPHYLLLTDESYQASDAQKYIMTPPLRKKSDNETLWESIKEETISCVVTDHCSFHIDDKLKGDSCFDAIPGIGGSETLLPLMFSEGHRKRDLPLEKLAALLSTNPAKIFGLYPQKGVIAKHSDADFVIIDPHKKVVIDGKNLHSAAGYSVFDGFETIGYPVATILRGEYICRDGVQIKNTPGGVFVKANL